MCADWKAGNLLRSFQHPYPWLACHRFKMEFISLPKLAYLKKIYLFCNSFFSCTMYDERMRTTFYTWLVPVRQYHNLSIMMARTLRLTSWRQRAQACGFPQFLSLPACQGSRAVSSLLLLSPVITNCLWNISSCPFEWLVKYSRSHPMLD